MEPNIPLITSITDQLKMFETRLLFMDYGYQEMAKIDIKITNDEKCSWNSPKEQRVAIIVKELGKVYEIVNVIKIS